MPRYDYDKYDDGYDEYDDVYSNVGGSNPPLIKIEDVDLTKWFYSDAFDFEREWKIYFGREEINSIIEQFAQIDPLHVQNDIQLRLVTENLKPVIGGILMRVHSVGNRVIKDLIKITKIEKIKGLRYYSFVILWPSCEAGFEGFFSEGCLFEQSFYEPEIFFHYNYKGKSGYEILDRADRRKSLFEELYELAQDLNILVQAWSTVHESTTAKYLSADYSHEHWRKTFKPRDEKIDHWLVWRIMWSLMADGVMFEIDQIFDKRRYGMGWFGHLDQVTPLLDQIQEEILSKILQDESLAEKIFPKGEPSRNRRLRVIFERFYGPKTMVHIETSAKIQDSSPTDWKFKAKLRAIVQLIKRGDTEGVREAANKAYYRIAGRPYSPAEDKKIREDFSPVII